MSKVVRKIGGAIKKVVKGVTKVVKGVVKGVGNVIKKVASSKFGKVLLAAATIYFGGAAIMGAMGGASAAAPGFMSTLSGAVQGAGAGISNAWAGLTGAVSGGGLSSLQSGFTGANAAGQTAVGGIQAMAPNIAAGAQASGATTQAVTGGSTAASQPLTSGGGSGIFGLGDRTSAALITGGMQIGGNMLAAKGQVDAQEEELARQTQNMSGNFTFGQAQGGGPAPIIGGQMPAGSGQPVAGGPAYVGRGLVGGQIQPYNPALRRYYA
jgi:hypothetical protein